MIRIRIRHWKLQTEELPFRDLAESVNVLAFPPLPHDFLSGHTLNKRLTAVIQREGDGFVAFCPELDIARQGDSIQDARDQLREALELYF